MEFSFMQEGILTDPDGKTREARVKITINPGAIKRWDQIKYEIVELSPSYPPTAKV